MSLSLINVEELPIIPIDTLTFWGERIDGSQDIWSLNDIGVKTMFNFQRINNAYVRYAIKLYLLTKSKNKSLSHVLNCYERLVAAFGDVKELSEESLVQKVENYIQENRKKTHEHTIWYLKSWYTWCTDLELPLFNFEYAEYLDNISISGNLKGQSVLSLDDNDGPLSENELSLLIALLNTDKNDSTDKLLAYLFLTLGTNPRNLLLLKWTDFSFIADADFKIYFLKVPRIKKRTIVRTDFKLRELDSRVGTLMEKLSLQKKGEYVFVNSLNLPYTTISLRKKFIKYIETISHGSDFEKIEITPRRLRYTFATRLVMSGVSKERLADLLDHTDLQNIQVYYDLRHKIKGYLTEAENKKLKHIVGRFEGTIKKSTEQGQKDIKYYSSKTTPILGSCGSKTLCDLSPPYSCFVCKKFNAFEDSLDSYKEVRDDLVSWKNKRIQEHDENDRIQVQMDEVLASLDYLISEIERVK